MSDTPTPPAASPRPRFTALRALKLVVALAAGAFVYWVAVDAVRERCTESEAGCACAVDWTCDAGAVCEDGWCWGGDYPLPATYYYTDANRRDIQLVKAAIEAWFPLSPGQTVADIGCGHGSLSLAAAERVAPTGRVIATDLMARALAMTRASVDAAATPGVPQSLTTVHVEDPRETGLEDEADGSVDVVLMINSVVFKARWVRGPDLAYLKAFRAKLRPGGFLLYHRDWLEPDDLGAADVTAFFQEAGFVPQPEIPLPPGIPEESLYYSGGPKRSPASLKRGYILVFQRPAT